MVSHLFNDQTSGMCKFGGNCHKQFSTNYLYVSSDFIVRVLIFVCLRVYRCFTLCVRLNVQKSISERKTKAPVLLKLLPAVGVIVHHLTERVRLSLCSHSLAASMDREIRLNKPTFSISHNFKLKKKKTKINEPCHISVLMVCTWLEQSRAMAKSTVQRLWYILASKLMKWYHKPKHAHRTSHI